MTDNKSVAGSRIDGVIDFFDITYGGTVFKLTPFNGADPAEDSGYTSFPMELSEVEDKSGGTQPSPTLTISNINKIFASIIFGVGDFSGGTVRRDRFATQGGLIASHTWKIIQTEALTSKILVLRLGTTIDQPNKLSPHGNVTTKKFPGLTRLSAL